MPHIAKARELVRAGRIGKVLKVHMTWNRNTDRVRRFKAHGIDPKEVDWKAFLGKAPEQPFDEYRFRNWRWFWDFGGGLFTDLMVHWIDVAHWVLGPRPPGEGGQPRRARRQPRTSGRRPTPCRRCCNYPGGIQMHFEGTFANARDGAHIEFMGTEANLYIDRGALRA